jgi:transporter family-2 protein
VDWPYVLFAFAAGAALPVQFGINAQLSSWLELPGAGRVRVVPHRRDHPCRGRGAPLQAPALRSGSRLGHAPSWVWAGGAFGAFYVVASIVAAPRLGAATVVAVIVAGQSMASVVVDHYGWVGFQPRHVSAGRLLGMALVGAGVALVRFF